MKQLTRQPRQAVHPQTGDVRVPMNRQGARHGKAADVTGINGLGYSTTKQKKPIKGRANDHD